MNRGKLIVLSVVFLSCVIAGCVVHPRAGGAVVVVDHAPPPPRVVVRPRAPSHLHVWIPGRWHWQNRWVWRQGHWAVPPRGAKHWVPGHWKQRRRGWVWIEGHWSRG